MRILLTHGEHDDVWNRLDYPRLPGPGSPPGASHDRFAYPPGSRLVKTLLHPLKRRFHMRFADILKPDFCGAVLTALAIDPGDREARVPGVHVSEEASGPSGVRERRLGEAGDELAADIATAAAPGQLRPGRAPHPPSVARTHGCPCWGDGAGMSDA